MLKRASVAFSAGVVGAVVNSLALWLFGATKIHTLLHVAIAPALSAQWLYPRLVWGGLWGLLFATPLLRNRGWSRGAWLSLIPTAVQLFYFFPYQAQKGLLGWQLGSLTPGVVLVCNVIWGLSAAAWLRLTGAK